MTLGEAQDFVASIIESRDRKGAPCPACGQKVAVYRRALNAPMARLLIWLVLAYQKDPRWYEIKEFPTIQKRKGGGDFAKLAHWGFLRALPKDPTDSKRRTSGVWAPTEAAISFVHGRTKAPAAVFLYANVKIGFDDELITCREALGVKWDYYELMGITPLE
jgi:hypothetical protein